MFSGNTAPHRDHLAGERRIHSSRQSQLERIFWQEVHVQMIVTDMPERHRFEL